MAALVTNDRLPTQAESIKQMYSYQDLILVLSLRIPRQLNIALTLYYTTCTLSLNEHSTLSVAITRRLVRNKLLVNQFRRESQ